MTIRNVIGLLVIGIYISLTSMQPQENHYLPTKPSNVKIHIKPANKK